MVIPMIVASVREDAVTPEMLEILRKDYVKQHKNDKDFEAYVSSLKSQEKQQELQKHLQETMINEDIELFTMEDLDGKKVDLSRWRGRLSCWIFGQLGALLVRLLYQECKWL